jgi:eukaryotic-like serine/threonine-protein kinase
VGLADAEAIRYCTRCRAVYHADFVRCPNDGVELAVGVDDPLVGTAVSHYEIDAYLGAGAMGRVYRCHHSHLQHKQFALKVLRGDLAATMAMRLRFTQEAEAASRLVHPNVVSVLDFGRTDDGLLYIAMELVEGKSLTEVIAARPMSSGRVIRIGKQLCLGLAHAHDHHFVHRDFKPDNIIVVDEGEGEVPKIVDFGLAISADPDGDSARLTSTGVTVGTPIYAAPEQMRGGEVDYRTDLFGLGVTLFEMLSGTVPFDGSILETIHFNAESVRPKIADRAPGVVVPARLERLVQRMIAAVPDDRPSSARAVYDELGMIELELEHRAAASITPVPIDSIGVTERVPRRRSRVGWIVAALAVVAVVAGWVTGFGSSHEPVASTIEPSPPHPAVATIAEPPARPAVAAIPDPPAPASAKTSRSKVAPKRTPAHVHAAHAPVVAQVEPTVASPEVSAVAQQQPPQPSVQTEPPLTKPIAPLPQPVKPTPVITKAKLAVSDFSVRGSLTPAVVRRALDRVTPAVTACYGPAAIRAGRSPTVDVRAHFEIDESQLAHEIQIGATALPGLSDCVNHALAGVRTEAPPDVGTEDVAVLLKFVPEGS